MWTKLLAFIRAQWVSIRVITTFVLLIIAFFFVLTWGPIVDRVDIGAALAKISAWLSYGLVKLVGPLAGYQPHRIGTIMGAGDFEVDVAPACSGAVPLTIYLSAVFAYPTSWRARLHGALFGVAMILVVNLFRVAGLFWIGLYFREAFHETHVYVAQALVVCVAVALWLYWAARFADAPAR
jgi:exosortase/archaeosortase family protein